MAPLLQHTLYNHVVSPVIFCLKLNETLLPGKSSIAPALVEAGLSL